MSKSLDILLKEVSFYLNKISGGRGCDLVTGTSAFVSRLNPIYAIISNEDDSRIQSVTVGLSTDSPETVLTGMTYMSTKRVDTVTLTGTTGTATLTCNAIANTVTFATDIETTIDNYVTANAAAHLVAGQVLTGTATDFVFTAVVAGTTFTGATALSAASDDLVGTVVLTTANALAAINDNKLIIPDKPIVSITLGKGSVWVYYADI